MSFPLHPSIAIVGAGAVGGYYGARLAQHGADVHFLFRSDYSAVRSKGLVVQSHDGDFTLPPERVRAYDDPQKMPAVDLLIVALKTTSNDQLASLVSPLLKPGTMILTLQNGLGNEELLADQFGAERVLGGLAFVCINRIAPGVIRHTDHGLIRLGDFTGPTSSTPRARAISDLFNASGIRCEVLDDLRYGRWEKLVWNVPFNGLGAALDLPTGRILATEDGRRLVAQLMGEVIATAQAIGVALPGSVIRNQIERTPTMGDYRTSMQIDRQENRPMEVEAILGRPLGVARSMGVSTPALEWLYRLVRLVNSGKANIGLRNEKILH